MSTEEIKTKLHEMIEEINNKEFLLALYDILNVQEQIKPGELWENLSDNQKKELLLSFEESESDKGLIRRDQLL